MITIIKSIRLVACLVLFVAAGSVAAQALSSEAKVCQVLHQQSKFDQAFPRCLKAANEGDAVSQLALANQYETGRGVAQDKALAHAWYLRAAKLGNTKGQLQVARMYRDGIGTKADTTRAKLWLAQAQKSKQK